MRTLLITFLFVFAGFPLLSQQEGVPTYEDALAMYEDLFLAEEPLDLTLRFDVKALQKARELDVYHEAVMIHMEGSEFEESHSVQVRARETIRRKFCELPPLSLNIGNSEIRTDSLQDVFRMNMVVPCKNAAPYESYVLREYLAYRLYNIITPLSYQVRLVKLSIVDTGKGNEVTEKWAFLQEPDELMTLRLKSMMIDSDNLSLSTVNPEVINSLSMFQYMIGNADYSVTGRHNMKILTQKEYGPTGFITIPYDFDYSGLVNADYAVPSESLGTSSVRERYYLGPCRPMEVHKETILELGQFEDEILKYIKDFEYLEEKEKVDMVEYLESYFKESRETWFIDRRITPTCR